MGKVTGLCKIQIQKDRQEIIAIMRRTDSFIGLDLENARKNGSSENVIAGLEGARSLIPPLIEAIEKKEL